VLIRKQPLRIVERLERSATIGPRVRFKLNR
jgi:hypothetical protein